MHRLLLISLDLTEEPGYLPVPPVTGHTPPNPSIHPRVAASAGLDWGSILGKQPHNGLD